MGESRSFEFQVPEGTDAAALIARVRGRAREVGIRIEGDATGGTFDGMAEGRYDVDGLTVRLDVEKKPAFVPWSMLESGLRRAFS